MSKRLIISWQRGALRVAGVPQAVSGASAQQLFGSQQLIHRTGAESFQIERDELESQRLKHGCEFASHLLGQSAREFVARNLNAHDFSVMTYTELPEAHCT